MYDFDLSLPWITSPWWILVFFIVSLVILHILFVRQFPLSSVGWKQSDYIWLPMALLGIIGSVNENRTIVIETRLFMAMDQSAAALHRVIYAAESGTSIAICRTFVVSPESPPPEVMAKTQREFDAQCAWFKKVVAALKTHATKDNRERLDVVQLIGQQPSGGHVLTYHELEQSLAWYNETLEYLKKLEEAKKDSSSIAAFRFLVPLLIALALALRITKVTGEIALERARQPPKV